MHATHHLHIIYSWTWKGKLSADVYLPRDCMFDCLCAFYASKIGARLVFMCRPWTVIKLIMFADKIAEHMKCLQQGKSDSNALHVHHLAAMVAWQIRSSTTSSPSTAGRGGMVALANVQPTQHEIANLRRHPMSATWEGGYDRKTFLAHTCLYIFMYIYTPLGTLCSPVFNWHSGGC